MCPYGMRARTALAEKGIPYRSHQIDPGEKVPEFCGVPVALVDVKRVVVESLSTLEYPDGKWPEPLPFAPHLPGIARGTPEERVLARASFIADLPRDWRPVQLGFERLGRWERTGMSRPAVRDQMAVRLPG